MYAKRAILSLFITTAVALCYVHLQTSQIILSYNVKTCEVNYQRLLDYNAHLKYNKFALGSCRNLEKALASQKTAITWPSESKVITMALAKPQETRQANKGIINNAFRQLASIFTIKREAHATALK
ncbi:MAG: hypothetical protein ABIH01_04970 [Candidatus Omnitrophota bacterium]